MLCYSIYMLTFNLKRYFCHVLVMNFFGRKKRYFVIFAFDMGTQKIDKITFTYLAYRMWNENVD